MTFFCHNEYVNIADFNHKIKEQKISVDISINIVSKSIF